MSDVLLRTQISHHVVFPAELDSICGRSCSGGVTLRSACPLRAACPPWEHAQLKHSLPLLCCLPGEDSKNFMGSLMVHQPTDVLGFLPVLPMASPTVTEVSVVYVSRRQRERERRGMRETAGHKAATAQNTTLDKTPTRPCCCISFISDQKTQQRKIKSLLDQITNPWNRLMVMGECSVSPSPILVLGKCGNRTSACISLFFLILLIFSVVWQVW